MTSLAVTRETERGTMENLLAMPLLPSEVMLGKILPYVAVGYVQVTVVLLAARYLFGVPMLGSLALLLTALLAFIAANLAVGFTFSTIARNQLQAMQLTFFFFLPSILLSGFMFPFRGMPDWAQAIGTAIPVTHFLRVVRGALLKGEGLATLWPSHVALGVFVCLVTALAMGQGLALLSGNIAAGRYVQDGTAVGDVISVDGVEGTVEELGYASVTVRSEDGHIYRIPNRTLLENVVRKRG